MAWVAESNLASAVSNAGGLGIIGTGHDQADVVRQKISDTQAKTNKSFGVNIMLLNPHVDDVIQVICESGVKVVTTGAGSPAKYMEQFKQAGITVIPVVASVALAKRMEKDGSHAIIVEGMEAGRHIGKTTTIALLPQVVDSVSIPVIAAGGIGDGRGMAAAFMMGASAVQIETRFIVAKECHAHDNFKQAVIKGKDLENQEDAVHWATQLGYPVILKAVAGGGGKGMRKVYKSEDLISAFQTDQGEAKAAFGDGRMYMEKIIQPARHIEFQILADRYGHVIHVGERDCSLQRHHQKVLEETPSTYLTPELREAMGKATVLAAQQVDMKMQERLNF